MHKEFNDRNAEGFSLNDFAKPPITSATPKPRAGEVCDVCGGRKSACDVLGHRQPGDKTEWQQKPRAGEHTKGPWAVGPLDKNGQRVIRAEHLEVCTCWHHSVGALETSMENNATRIVACVNACEGLPTEELEQYAKHGPYTGYTDLKAERDLLRERERELVEALQTLQSSANCHLGKGGIMLPLEAAILHAGDVLAKHGR